MMLKTIQLISLRTTSPSVILSRNYVFKSDLKIKWRRPKKISCILPEKSGDLNKFENPDGKKMLLDFEKSEELKDANELVRNIFSLELNPRVDSTNVFRKETIDMVKRHDLDLGSVESKIAKMTAQILAMQQKMEEFPRNKVVKVQLKEMIDKRQKFLKFLRRWDYRRFEWLLEKLNIVYKPAPELFHWIARKESIRKLTNIHCENVKKERLDAYKAELESQQLGFLEDKIKNLEFIRNEQIECKVPVTISVEEIQVVKQQFLELKQKRDEEAEIRKQQSVKEDYELNL